MKSNHRQNRLPFIDCTRGLGEGDVSKSAAVDKSPLSLAFNRMYERLERQISEIRESIEGHSGVQELNLSVKRMSERIESQITEIRESEERFRAAFEKSPAAIALIDAEGHFLKINRALLKLCGYTQEELLSKSVHDLLLPEDVKSGRTPAERTLNFTMISHAVEKRFMHKAGKTVTGLVSISSLEKDSRVGASHIIHIQDITEQKAAQVENQKLESQLYHAQKMEAIGTLAAGIAHDFNNILSVIIGNAELAMQQAQAGAAVCNHLENVLQASKRAAHLTRQILSFSRSEKSELAPIPLNTALKEAVMLLRSSIPPHISIVNKISNEYFLVNADPTQMHQLLMNLCTNSYHAMSDKGFGTIEVSLAPEWVRLPGDPEAKAYLKLQVADTGCGMTPEVMKRIFEPYFTTKQKGRGTGLGLSIVHSIVEKHGGTIRVDSEPGRGTTFTIHLPIVDQVSENKTQVQPSLTFGSESILIVDDEADITAIWQQILTRQGYDVTVRNHAHAALEEFKKNPERYSLIITDLAMPDLTGDKLIEEISRINPRVPIILCTGYCETTRTITQCSTVKQHLLKPVNLVTLAETVRRVMDHPESCPSQYVDEAGDTYTLPKLQ